MGSSSSVMFTVAMPLVPLATRSGRSNRGVSDRGKSGLSPESPPPVAGCWLTLTHSARELGGSGGGLRRRRVLEDAMAV